MIEWNRDAAGYVQLVFILMYFVLLIVKSKKLGNGIFYLIIAAGIVFFTDTYILTMRLNNPKFNSAPIYSVAVNFFVFLLYFLYFRIILHNEKSRQTNLVTLIIFVSSYLIFAVTTKNFFKVFPFNFYFTELILLVVNIFLVLRETFNSDKILNIKSYYPFWVCIGMMALYLGITPLLIISHSLVNVMNVNIFFIILFLINILGYSILITGIFYGNKLKKKREPFRN